MHTLRITFGMFRDSVAKQTIFCKTITIGENDAKQTIIEADEP